MTQPHTSSLAKAVHIFVMTSILISCACYILSTVSALNENHTTALVFDYMDIVCMQVFATEVSLRMLTCPNLKKFFSSKMNAVDLISIIPPVYRLHFD